MVIPPILGEALLDVIKAVKGEEAFGGIGAGHVDAGEGELLDEMEV